MARQAGPNYFIGRIGDLIYYKSNGVFLVKKAPLSDKKISKKEHELRKLKEGRIEFGGAATLTKVFRDTFNSCIVPFNDRSLTGRLNRILRDVIQKGSGKEGMRKAEFLKNKNSLIGFEFHQDYIFDHIFRCPIKWEMKKGRKEIAMVVPDFNPKGNISRPAGATHFKIVLTVGIISDHSYSKTKGKYVPLVSSFNKKFFIVCSDAISFRKAPKEISIPVVFKTAIPDACSVVALTMIEFYKEEAGELYSLETKRAMKIANVM